MILASLRSLFFDFSPPFSIWCLVSLDGYIYITIFENPKLMLESCLPLSEVIKSDILIAYTQRVEQVEDALSHHRRTAEVVLDIFRSFMLLEVGIASLPRCSLLSLPRPLASPRAPQAHARTRLRYIMMSRASNNWHRRHRGKRGGKQRFPLSWCFC